jgi:hypothetical protein
MKFLFKLFFSRRFCCPGEAAIITPSPATPLNEGSQYYTMLKFILCFFRLNSVLLIEGGILGNWYKGKFGQDGRMRLTNLSYADTDFLYLLLRAVEICV